VVDKLSLVNNEYILYIGDKKYTLQQVMEVGTGGGNGGEEGAAGEK